MNPYAADLRAQDAANWVSTAAGLKSYRAAPAAAAADCHTLNFAQSAAAAAAAATDLLAIAV